MTDWNSPSQIELDIKIYKAYIFCLLGVIFWELVTTIGYDISVLIGWIPWRWPMIAYFVSRYFTIIYNIGAIVFVQRTNDPSLNCDLLVKLIFVFGEVALWMASSIFILRAIALSSWRKKTGIFLVSIWLVQGALCLYSAFTVDAVFTEGVGCHVTHTSDAFSAGFWMALVVDSAAFIIIVQQLRKAHQGVRFAKLARVLIKDGLIYVTVAVTFHLLSVILIQLKLNAILQIFPAPMATVFPSILACRAFRELSLAMNEAKMHDRALPASRAKREEKKRATAKAKFWHGWENANTPSIGTSSNTQETSARNQSRPLQLNEVTITETRAHSSTYGQRNDEDVELNNSLASPTSPGFMLRRGLKPWDTEKGDYFNSSNPSSPTPTPLTPTFSFNRVRRDRTTSNTSVPFSGPGFTVVSGSDVSPNGDLMSPSTMIGDYSPRKSEFGAEATRDNSSDLDRPEQINTNFVDDEIPNSEIPSPTNQSSVSLQPNNNQSSSVETSRAFHIDMGDGYKKY